MTGDQAGTSGGGRFETFDANRWFVVARDVEGYGVWRLDDLEVDDPIARFGDDDDGYRSAADHWRELTREGRRQRWLPRLKWVVVILSAIVWSITAAISAILFLQVGITLLEGSGVYDTLVRWSQLASSVAMPLTLGGFAIYAVLWLESRRS
jgi:hypothetical protein